MLSKQNISVVLDECTLFEDGELVVAVRDYSITWYSRASGGIVQIAEKQFINRVPAGNGAILADGVFAYYSENLCIIAERRENVITVSTITPKTEGTVKKGWKFVGIDTEYTSWACFARADIDGKYHAFTTDIGSVILAGSCTEIITISGNDITCRDLLTGKEQVVGERALDTDYSAKFMRGPGVGMVKCVCYDNYLWINGRSYEFDTPVLAVWFAPAGIIVMDNDPENGDQRVWIVKMQDRLTISSKIEMVDDPEPYYAFEWIWYNSAHDDFIGLDVSGRACIICES